MASFQEQNLRPQRRRNIKRTEIFRTECVCLVYISWDLRGFPGLCATQRGLNARPRFKPVTTPRLYVARVRVAVVALAVEGLITRHNRSRNG